ncbi:hypothetical protein [Rheinheimera sp. 1928-s]|uniref:hypothetical protein n=1 Tax=Rheinheimera sp. 1928-s TaxID=3033803 RepID=UPI002626CDB8|nr:hypothetical protein [Rheinheimera sp. 1928-s]MDF3125700.1 hypothetical protein [Rheinheimera sp. 1928-s]
MVWSFFPVTILGVVFLYENLYTLNSRKSYFSALSIFLAFGFSFFYIVPFNQLIWDYWPSIPVADGMSGWVGGWAILCLLGFFITAIGCKSTKVNFRRPLNYHIDTNKMHMPFIVGIVFCLICQIVVLVKMGGYDGYLNAYELRLEDSIQNYNPYDGFGFLFTFSESLPNLVAIYLVLFIKDKSWSRDVKVLVSLLVFLFLLNMLFGGLRGSRSTTVWSLFWFVVVYHNNVKELSLKLLVALGAIFFLFMTSYSLYKFGGIEGLQGLWDKDIKAQVFEQKYIEDSEKFALVRDAGRADVQSYILKTYWNDEYPLSYGRTLVAGAVSFVPGFLLPNKPVTAIKEKTGIFWSDYSFTDSSYTTLLAGGYGEFVINFGIFFGLTFFYIFGVVISWIDGYSKVFPKDGVYNLIVPVLVLLSIQLLMSDSNVVSQFLFRFLTVPLIVLLCCPKIVKSNN